MSNKVKFELNIYGLNELMKSGEMQDALSSAGQAAASASGDGFGSRTHVASFVAIANVYPETKEAAKKNYQENTIVKACQAVGLKM